YESIRELEAYLKQKQDVRVTQILELEERQKALYHSAYVASGNGHWEEHARDMGPDYGRGKGGYTDEQLRAATKRLYELRPGLKLRAAQQKVLEETGVNLRKVDVDLGEYL